MEELSEGKKEAEKIGFSKKVTFQALEELVNKRDEVRKKFDASRADSNSPILTIEQTALRQQIESIQAKISEVRDWYGIRVLEGLDEESRRLKWLTIVLIALTTVLAIFTGFLVSGIRFP